MSVNVEKIKECWNICEECMEYLTVLGNSKSECKTVRDYDEAKNQRKAWKVLSFDFDKQHEYYYFHCNHYEECDYCHRECFWIWVKK